MPSVISGYEYDIFISYRQNDNKRDRWVTEFVEALQDELDATVKEKISIYFDQNIHDGLLETYDVDQSLNDKVKCLVFIPIVSQTYCDPKSFAWQKEFLPFLDFAKKDKFGLDVKLANGNVTKRILPVRIHDLDRNDLLLFEKEIQGVMRPVDFIFKSQGVNRPLISSDSRELNLHNTFYRDQINKTANTIKEMLFGIVNFQEIKDGKEFDDFKKTAEFIPSGKDPVEVKTGKSGADFWRMSKSWGGLLVAIILSSSITGMLFWQFSANNHLDEDSSSLKLSILPPKESKIELIGDATVGVGRRVIDISSKGDRIAFIGRYKEHPHIFIRNLNEFEARVIPETKGAYACRLSPDGTEVAYFVSNSLFKVKIEGGSPVKLAEIANPMDIIWYDESTLYFSADEGSTLYKFEKGMVKRVADSFSRSGAFNSIAPIPGKSHLVISTNNKIELYNISADSIIDLKLNGNSARYVFPNKIVFAWKSALYYSEIDLDNKVMVSKPKEIFNGVRTEVYGSSQYALSNNGTLIYIEGEDSRLGEFTWVNKNGESEKLEFSKEDYGAYKLSNDQTKIATPIFGTTSDIWILDLEKSKKTRVTNSGYNGRPVWYDENSLFIGRDNNTYLINSTKVVEPKLILENASPESVSLNGKFLVVRKEFDLFKYEIESKKLTTITNTPEVIEFHGSISPDGSLIAYTRNDLRAFHVYLQKTNGDTDFIQISIREGSEEPRWTADGKSIIYRSGQQWMKVEILDPAKLEVGKPELVISGDYINIGGFSFDISKEGDRFLMVKGTPYKTADEIKVITNWFPEREN